MFFHAFLCNVCFRITYTDVLLFMLCCILQTSELPDRASEGNMTISSSQSLPEETIMRISISESPDRKTPKRESRVKINIPHMTPTATISALSQMLWEDVLRQAKKTADDYRGRDDTAVSRKKIQSAQNMLKAAYVEFYRGLGLLKSYG